MTEKPKRKAGSQSPRVHFTHKTDAKPDSMLEGNLMLLGKRMASPVTSDSRGRPGE